MQAALPGNATSTQSRPFAWPVTRAENSVPTYVYAVVFSSFCIVMGLLWDIMWHMSIGRDGLFSPPHLVIYVGALVSGLFSGYQILSMTLSRNHPGRPRAVRFWGIFYGSLGAMYCVWGALAMLTSAPFDDWWHSTYGLDVEILTPPHSILALGMMMVQFGAIVGVLALQNRTSEQENPRLATQSRWLFVISAGLLQVVVSVLLAESLGDWASHSSSYYVAGALAFPLFMIAFGRASALRYPMTAVAAVYMITYLLPNWILPLFEATPKLGPVLNPITHYQAFAFPMLLVIPAFALDLLFNRLSVGRATKPLSDWWLAVLAGLVFMGVFLAVQWPFGGFLLESPYARNWFFYTDAWSYNNDPTWEYRFKFSPWMTQSTADFAIGFGKAILIAVFMSRIGLWWGNWMKRIVR